jgi:hypothetical protein
MSPILTPEQINTLVAMAMRDSTLKQELLDNPHAAVHTHLGVEVPPTKTLRVIQAETQTLTLVIPPRPADWPSDLSVEDATARLLSELPALDDKARKATEFQMQLTARAWRDEPFKHRLLHDAKAAVVQELAVTLPDELNVAVFIADDDHQYVVLPSAAVGGMELSDEQLEAVAGGEALLIAASVSITVAYVSVTSLAVGFTVSAGVSIATSW